VVASAAPPAVDAGAPPPAPAIDEAPLAWGTRPPKNGPLFPVIDGMCVHAEVWRTGKSAILTYGNNTGPWSRGATATLARFVDDGLAFDGGIATPADAKKQSEWEEVRPVSVLGTWPSPLVIYSNDGGMGRMRSYESLWTHGDDGWRQIASFRETGSPSFSSPFIFHDWLAATTAMEKKDTSYEFGPATVKTWPLKADAAPIAGIGDLTKGGFVVRDVMTGENSIWAFGYFQSGAGGTNTVKVWKDGKVSEIHPPTAPALGVQADALVTIDDTAHVIRRIDATGTTSEIPFTLPETPRSRKLAPNGDVWMLTSKGSVVIVSKAGKTTETHIPSAASPLPHEDTQHWPSSGSALAGVEFDDPWAIVEGSLFHLENGQWKEIAMPTPPFASKGKYQAQLLSMTEKGDLFVNAGYAEKGLGWKRQERYRAILRTKRPKEVLRCNEPAGGSIYESGSGFMSFPPIADDSCKTPVTILVRLAWNVNSKQPHPNNFDRKSDYPAIRSLMKGMSSLGTTVELVDFVSGNQRYLGAKVPTNAAGVELALAAAKKGLDFETRPEVVCGTPKSERTVTVDIATGKAL
jgi:hypothetical protein